MKIARYIETFSIDELPQLWNVFIWDMTLVGPRPHQPREVEKYEIHQEQVLTVKPGITGMAQVSWREKLQIETEAALDIAYIEHWSIWLDFRILIKTIFVVLQRWFQKF
jgi:lipopolysaccharide/colanic/teichoic acid biosynthesis glycosyltransferase